MKIIYLNKSYAISKQNLFIRTIRKQGVFIQIVFKLVQINATSYFRINLLCLHIMYKYKYTNIYYNFNEWYFWNLSESKLKVSELVKVILNLTMPLTLITISLW